MRGQHTAQRRLSATGQHWVFVSDGLPRPHCSPPKSKEPGKPGSQCFGSQARSDLDSTGPRPSGGTNHSVFISCCEPRAFHRRAGHRPDHVPRASSPEAMRTCACSGGRQAAPSPASQLASAPPGAASPAFPTALGLPAGGGVEGPVVPSVSPGAHGRSDPAPAAGTQGLWPSSH